MKMFLHCPRFRVSIFIVLSLYQGLASYKPIRLKPSDELSDKFVVEEGQLLQIECKGNSSMKFIYPNRKSINTSTYYIHYIMISGLYYYNFERPKTVFGDTGWYSCTYHNFSTNSYDNEMDWLYVYVKSEANVFVETDTNVHLTAAIGGNVVIPCRTTLPDLKPILKPINGNEDKLNEVSYDPKIGFTIRNLSLEDSNQYTCLIEKNGEKHAVSYMLSVLKQTLPKPKIQVNDLFITRGQVLNMNCTVKIKLSMEYEIKWNMPRQNNSRKSIELFKKQLDENIALVTSQLIIFNISYEDSGTYECIIRSIYHQKKITRNIRIHDPQMKLIKFFPAFNSSYFRRKSGNYIRWIIFIDAFLETVLQWFKPNGKEIAGYSENFEIFQLYESNGLLKLRKNWKTVSSLNINLLNVTDSGNYTLQAKNGYMIERMNITLDVTDNPISTLTHIGSYYLLNESTEFLCEVISNPPPNITWSFLKCPNYPSLENSTMVHLTNVTQSTIYSSNYKYESIVKMPIEISGMITCKACNNLGCDSKTENIMVSDLIPPFFIKTNMNKTKTKIIDAIVEGHNTVILQCIADGMPKPTVTWYKDNMLLKESDQYFFKNNHQELHIKYLILQDSGKYSCRATNSMGINETYQQITMKITKWHTLGTVLAISIPIVGCILIILTIIFMIKIHREKKIKKELMDACLLNFEEGALECLNPKLTVDEQAELLPYDKKWEFPRERLKLKEPLGSGQFGVVMKAEAIRICKNENVTTVAVKMVHRTTNPIYIRALASELKIMVHLGKHLNVVNLLGACTKNISKCELLVIVEYCHFGNIRNYLLRHRHDFINQINPKSKKLDFTIGRDILTRIVSISNDSLNTNSNPDMVQHYCPKTNPNYSESNFLQDCVLNSNSCQPEGRSNYCDDYGDQNLKLICTQDLLSWAFQVARGMEYLSQRKVLHGDLAARNILLTENNVVKICDFGLAKNIYKDGNYKKKSNAPVPVKWMAIESIRDQLFSTQSDVWSFGIMLWEFLTLGKTPYPGMEMKKQYQKLIEGYRMEQPDYATREIYDIMLQCWEVKPTLRPSFTDLVGSIGNLLEENVRMHYIILNNPYMDMNTMKFKSGKSDYLMKMSAPDHVVPSFLDNNSVNTQLSTSKDASDSSYLDIRPNCSLDEFGMFRSHQDHSDSEFPLPMSEHAVELFPIPKHEEEPYLKPINVYQRRAELARMRQTIMNQISKSIDQNSIYCNVPQNSLEVEDSTSETDM